jgi:signal transduction histidine kinase
MTESSDQLVDVEARRLAALARYEVLGTPPEAMFDRVVAIVAAVFDAPIAMITLVDRDQCWYKAEIGMGLPGMPRSDNMCDATIEQDGVLVINDTESAPQDLVRPLLKRGMRAYAGAPLRTQDGVKIGTLCVVDSRPRQIGEKEQQILADLAQVVISQLELRLAARTLSERDETLRRLNRQLETANRNKSEFLANMSHELRSPLNGVLGATELLSQEVFGSLNEKQKEYLRDIHQSGMHLLSLIDDVLDLSRIEAGQIDLNCRPLEVASLMETCAAFVRGFATAKSITMKIAPSAEPLQIHADERRTTQVVCNILGNALKFTPPQGTVQFRAWQDGEQVTFMVEDEGPGIPPHYHDRIFEQFFRVPSDEEGTGLGLPLSKQLVEVQGGRIWLESEPERGSRFFFSLPRASQP